MKRLLIISAVIFAVILCSFRLQRSGIKKIGTDLYSVNKTFLRQISPEDRAALQKIIGQRYGITDWNKTIVIGKGNVINKRGGGVVDNLFDVVLIDQKSVIMGKGREGEEGKQVSAILAKYAK